MGISFDLPTKCSFALGFPPPLPERQKESLFTSQSVDDDIGFSLQREDISIVCCMQSCQVGDVLGQDLLPVDTSIGKRAVGVELRHQLRCCRVILREIV